MERGQHVGGYVPSFHEISLLHLFEEDDFGVAGIQILDISTFYKAKCLAQALHWLVRFVGGGE